MVDTTVAGMLLIGDPWVTHPDSSVLELGNRTNCRGVGPEDHPLLLAVQGEAVVEELGALLTPVAALGAAVGAKAVEAGKDVEGVGSGDDALLEWLIACWGTDWGPGETHRPWTPGRPPRMRPRGLTMAKKVAKVSVIGDTAGEKKRLAADPQVLTISQLRIPVAVPQNPRIFADWVVRHGPWGAFRRVSSRSLAASTRPSKRPPGPCPRRGEAGEGRC